MKDENCTDYVLKLLTAENYDYVVLVNADDFSFVLHVNEGVSSHNMPLSGELLELISTFSDEFLEDPDYSLFRQKLSKKNILSMLQNHNEFSFAVDFMEQTLNVEVHYYDDDKSTIVIAAKRAEDLEETDDENQTGEENIEGLIIMEMDSQKRFTIKNVSENVHIIFKMTLSEFLEQFGENPFAGFLSVDRLKAQEVCIAHAYNNATFEGVLNVSANPNNFKFIHFDVRVKALGQMFIYYVSVRSANERLVILRQRLDTAEEVRRARIQTFDIDFITKKIYLGQEMQEFFRCPPILENFPEPFFKSSFIHPDDKPILENICETIVSGPRQASFEIRVRNPGSKIFTWRQVNFTILFDDKNRPVRALVSSEDATSLEVQGNHFKNVLELCGVVTWDYYIKQHYVTNGIRLTEVFGKNESLITNVPDCLVKSGAVHKDDVGVILDLHKRLENGEVNPECEARFFNVQYQMYFWYRIRYTLITDADGKAIYAIGSATDINDLKVAEMNFRSESQTLSELQGEHILDKSFVNLTSDLIVKHTSFSMPDLSCKNVPYSSYLADLMDSCPDKKTADEISSRMSADALIELFKNGTSNLTLEYKRRDSENGYKWVCSKINLYEDVKTREIMAFQYTYDIDRKKITQEAFEIIGTEDFDFVSVIDTISGKSFTLHLGGSQHYMPTWNGVDYNEFFRNYADRIHPLLESEEDYIKLHDGVSIPSLVKQLKKTPKYNVVIRQRDEETGELMIFRSIYRYLDAEKNIILSCTSNITEVMREESEREMLLQNALNQATAASAAKTNFLAKMSHDIRTPLNGIMGMTQVALQEDDIDAVHEYLREIDRSSQFLLELLNDILDMSEIEQGVISLNREVYTLNDFRDQLVSIIRPLCKNRNIKLNMNFSGDFGFITDRQKLNQIFLNILSNSVKFTAESGSIDFSVSSRLISGGRVELVFVVSDTGCGMNEEFQKHMFEEFSQEKVRLTDSSQGTGLGLAIVKSLVDKMDGTISVQSSTDEKNHGTKFTIMLTTELA